MRAQESTVKFCCVITGNVNLIDCYICDFITYCKNVYEAEANDILIKMVNKLQSSYLTKILSLRAELETIKSYPTNASGIIV